ncbi:MAG: hypothetical protein AAF824_08980 [Bacteroidota bacterium]
MKAYIATVVLLFSITIFQAQPHNGVMYTQTSMQTSSFSKPYALNIPEVNEGILKEGKQKNISTALQEVSVCILVDEDGNYQFHQVKESLSSEKRIVLKNQLPELIFTPARLRGENVEAWVTIKVKV